MTTEKREKLKQKLSLKREKLILRLSFAASLDLALAEFIFAVYSHSQSALTDAVYDASELVFIGLLLFITPLFYKPVSEKHPFGYYQIETVFLVVKGIMMISVTVGVSAEILHSALHGGNHVNNGMISLFQFCLGIASIILYTSLKRLNHNLSTPAIKAELISWKLDIMYSMGMSFAFFVSLCIEDTPIGFITPYFDQLVAVVVMAITLPESIKILWKAGKEIFLFSPSEEVIEKIKGVCNPIMEEYRFLPVFYDITKTGRHLWIAIYFRVDADSLEIESLSNAIAEVNKAVVETYKHCSCELILEP